MKRLGTALVVAILPLLPLTAWAGSSTDAALGLGAFAVFNQILGGTGVFAGLAPAPQPVYYAPPQPVYVAPPPPVYVVPQPVYVAPRPVYIAPRPVYVAPRPVIVYRSVVPVYGRHAGFKHWNHGPHR
jgi:hypothetical protein